MRSFIGLVHRLFYPTIDDISVLYLTAHISAKGGGGEGVICRGLEKKVDLYHRFPRHRHLVGFFSRACLKTETE